MDNFKHSSAPERAIALPGTPHLSSAGVNPNQIHV